MGQIEGPVLKALISFMYGCLESIPVDIVLPLFLAADSHQVSLQTSMYITLESLGAIEGPACPQVEALRWTCLQLLITGISTTTVLGYTVVADAVTDRTLMKSCLTFILESKHR